MKLATVVVLFYPDASVADNIASYAKQSDFLYVWDNTPGRSSDSFYAALERKEALAHHNHVKYLHNQQNNMGLSFAYNRAIEEAEKDGATHLMTMDQDSCFEDFDVFVHGIEQNEKKPFGMFVPPLNQSSVVGNKEVTWAAQSGCVFDMELIRNVGMFREDFFIGMVDVEMQLRAQAAGYKMIQVGGCNLVHHVGSGRMVSFLGKTVGISDYGPLRHYYDSRNRILMWKAFPDDFDTRGKIKHYYGRLKVMVKILLFEKAKAKKIGAILRGTWNGLLGKTKPY